MQDFRKLHVWRESVDLAVLVYEATERFPRTERFGLRAQLRSAAVSVSSNIAEGCGRPGRRDMARFLGIAIGSICELESQFHITFRLGILEEADLDDVLRRLGRVKRGLIALYGRVRARVEETEIAGLAGRGTHHSPPTT